MLKQDHVWVVHVLFKTTCFTDVATHDQHIAAGQGEISKVQVEIGNDIDFHTAIIAGYELIVYKSFGS